jgi:hypothetical protein
MRALVIGASGPAAELAEALRAAGVEASVDNGSVGPGQESQIAAMAAELVRLEEALRDEPPAAVVLADAGDRALAAALVATKLLIPVAGVGLDGSDGENADVLAQLTDRKLSADPAEIAAWVEALPTLSEP